MSKGVSVWEERFTLSMRQTPLIRTILGSITFNIRRGTYVSGIQSEDHDRFSLQSKANRFRKELHTTGNFLVPFVAVPRMHAVVGRDHDFW